MINGISKTMENETKEQKHEFLVILLGPLGASIFGYMLIGKGELRAG